MALKIPVTGGLSAIGILQELINGSILASAYVVLEIYRVIPVFRPKDALLSGARILDPVLFPNDFRFQFQKEDRGSGGNFASGAFVRKDRRLELHFRYSLGLVRYHVGDQSASHESYMRELGVRNQCHYPGFSEDPMAAFRDLAHDLRFADDFLSGSAKVLRTAAKTEATDTSEQHKRAMAG